MFTPQLVKPIFLNVWIAGASASDIMYGYLALETVSLLQYVQELRTHLEEAYRHVREQIGRNLCRQKEIYDKRVHSDPYKPGDLMWLHNPAVPWGSKKLHRPWSGHFKVVDKISDAVYRAQNLRARRQHRVVHFDRLKPYLPDMRLPEAPLHYYNHTPSSFISPQPPGTIIEMLDPPDGRETPQEEVQPPHYPEKESYDP